MAPREGDTWHVRYHTHKLHVIMLREEDMGDASHPPPPPPLIKAINNITKRKKRQKKKGE